MFHTSERVGMEAQQDQDFCSLAQCWAFVCSADEEELGPKQQ
jgi:hypothetical protein